MKRKLKKIKKKISSRINQVIDFSNNQIINKVKALKNKHAAVGTVRNGRYCFELRDVLLKHLEEVFDIIWEGIFSYIKMEKIVLEHEDLLILIRDFSKSSFDISEQKLKEEVGRVCADEGEVINILTELNFRGTIQQNLNRKIKVYQDQQVPLEANMFTMQSRNIARWSLIVSIGALVVAFIAFLKNY